MTEFTGEVKRILFRKDDFMIGVLDAEHEQIKFTGKFYGIEKGELLTIRGDVTVHPRYGEQLQVTDWERPMPNTKEQVIDFLSSGMIKSCGEKRAKDIVDALGENSVKIINEQGSKSLVSINGIGAKTANEIANSVKETFEVQGIIQELSIYNISANITLELYKKYQFETADKVRDNPYILTEVEHVGFPKADEIAKKMGFLPTSTKRINACITYILNKICFSKGHTFVEERELVEQSVMVLNNNTAQEHYVTVTDVKDSIHLLEEQTLIIENDFVYPKYFHKYEDQIARKLSKMKGFRGGEALPFLKDHIKNYQTKNGIILASKQRQAIEMLMKEQVLVLTGGPGTGKTTVIKAMIDVFLKENKDATIRLAAPTGRASRKLKESTGYHATTIHHMIGYRQGEKPDFYDGNKLSGDLIIVDEFSMVDLQIAYYLIDALEYGAKLLIVGDVDQLPSVGSGNVLSDLIQSGIPTIKLNQIFRQAQESQIVTNAHRINNGQSLLIDQEKDDFYFIQNYNDFNVSQLIVRSAKRFIELGYSLEDILILSPMKKGDVGTIALNEMLREQLNPKHEYKKEITVGKRFFREGDKVLQTVNNKEKDVNNGELGVIVSITKGIDKETDKTIDVINCRFNDTFIKYKQSELKEIQLGYAMTIHKSQGGEAKIVIMSTVQSHYMMLARNLYYTGVTRAKEKVVLIGTYEAMKTAINNNRISERNSQLDKRLMAYNQEYINATNNHVEHTSS